MALAVERTGFSPNGFVLPKRLGVPSRRGARTGVAMLVRLALRVRRQAYR
jgi:hypothetical protein